MNGCVIWVEDTDTYSVIVTTDLSKSAKDIIKTYRLRPEIEEDYRQLKNFWKIQDFKSTKLVLIAFHIVSVLLGYLFFQIYTMLPDGQEFAGKSLPAILKKYQTKVQGHIIIYVDDMFGIFKLLDIMEIYANVPDDVKALLREKINMI